MSVVEAEGWLIEHGNALYAFALLHLRNPHHAEDAVQETLLAALQARERYTGKASVRTWLTSILKHKIIDEFRRQAREASGPDKESDDWDESETQRVNHEFAEDGHWRHSLSNWGDPERSAYSEQLWLLIERCIQALSPRAARLFVLRDLWEMEANEVCQELAITPNNLWTGLHRARLGMRQCLEQQGLG